MAIKDCIGRVADVEKDIEHINMHINTHADWFSNYSKRMNAIEQEVRLGKLRPVISEYEWNQQCKPLLDAIDKRITAIEEKQSPTKTELIRLLDETLSLYVKHNVTPRIAALEEYSHKPVVIDLEGFDRRIAELEEKLRGAEGRNRVFDQKLYELQDKLKGVYGYTPAEDTQEHWESVRDRRRAQVEPDIKALKLARKEALAKLFDALTLLDKIGWHGLDNTCCAAIAWEKYNEANDDYQDCRKVKGGDK